MNDGSAGRYEQEIADFSRAGLTVHIKLIELPMNRGVSYARNIGMAESQGDWIALHDADDVSLPARFTMSARFLQQQPEVIAVAGDMQAFNDQKHHRAARRANAPLCSLPIGKKQFAPAGTRQPIELGPALVFVLDEAHLPEKPGHLRLAQMKINDLQRYTRVKDEIFWSILLTLG